MGSLFISGPTETSFSLSQSLWVRMSAEEEVGGSNYVTLVLVLACLLLLLTITLILCCLTRTMLPSEGTKTRAPPQSAGRDTETQTPGGSQRV